MIQFKNFKILYTRTVDGIRFPNLPGSNFLITYFSENSSLLEDYPKLNFVLIDVKLNIIPYTMIPRSKITLPLIKSFKNLGIYSYSAKQKIPEGKNSFYDLSQYLNAIDYTFHPSNYRQRFSKFVKNIVNNSFTSFSNYEKILMYSIDLSKPFNSFIDRKFFPILEQIKDGTFNFDHLILCLLTPSGPRYKLLIRNKNLKFQKLITLLKSIKYGPTEIGKDDEEEYEGFDEIDQTETDKAVNLVMDQIQGKISEKNKPQVKDAVKSYIKKDNYTKEKILNKEVSPKNMEKVGVASILYKVTGDLNKSKKITNSLAKKNLEILYKL